MGALSSGLRIGSVLSNAARAVPDRAAVALDDETLTFAELNRDANRRVNALLRLGVGLGDRVATWSATSLDVMPLFGALAKLGAVYIPLNPALRPDELLPVAERARPHLLVVDDDHVPTATAVARAIGARTVTLTELASLAAESDGAEPEVEGPAETDAHTIFFTSGSTGRPKGAVISHRVNFLRTHPGALPEHRGPMVCPYPLFHMSIWTLALQQWQSRDLLVMLRSSDGAAICEAIATHRAERMTAIPAVWRRVLEQIETGGCDPDVLASMRFADTGTSATPLEFLEAIAAAAPNARVRVFYGSTEAGCVTGLDHDDIPRKPGSCGKPALLSEVRVDPGGELLVRGPLVFDGYYDDPEATAAAFEGDWYRTGDMAMVDDEGYLSIVGRVSAIIRTGGESVSPDEVEKVLAGHGSVSDVAVFGIADDRWGEVVCAAVVPVPGRQPPSVDTLREHCQGRLAPFKHPRAVLVVEVIPRTPATLQVQRRLLAEQFAAGAAG